MTTKMFGAKVARVVGEEVVDVAALASQEALVLDAGHLGAEHLRGHWSLPSVPEEGAPRPSSRAARSATISLARSTDFTMFW